MPGFLLPAIYIGIYITLVRREPVGAGLPASDLTVDQDPGSDRVHIRYRDRPFHIWIVGIR